MHAWIDVAQLTKTRNVNGRFVARAAAGLPFLLEEGDEVSFVPPQLDVPRTGIVADVRLIDERTADVAFEGIDAQSAAILVGSHCLLPRNSLDDGIFEEAPAMWEGWSVVDEGEGAVGQVSGFIDNPGQSLLEVTRKDGSTVLVPVVDEIVLDVDAQDCVIRVDLPSGLLDL